jgi:hypothetical protein
MPLTDVRTMARMSWAKFVALAMLLPIQAGAQDLALVAPVGSISSPVSGVGLSSNETVTVTIFSFGSNLPAGTAFNVNYSVNGGVPVTEMVVLGSTLLSNSPFIYTFTTQADLSVPASYTFTAAVSLPGDINPANDTYVNHFVTNTAASVGGTISRSPGGLLLTGHTGNIVRWEKSLDDGLTWQMLNNTTTTLPFEGADHREHYRAIVANGPAPPAISSVFDSANP